MIFVSKLGKAKIVRVLTFFVCTLLFFIFADFSDSYGQYRPRLPRKDKKMFDDEKDIMVGLAGVLGVSLLNQGGINDFLEFHGSNPLKPEKPYIGATGFVIYKRYAFELEGGKIWRNASSVGRVDAEYSGSLLFFNLGYLLVKEDNGRGYPYLGIGMGSSSIDFTNNLEEPFEFGEGVELIQPGGAAKVEYNKFLIQAGYHLIRTFSLSGTRTKQKGLHFSLKAGFVIGLGGNKWELGGTELTDSPKATLNSVYARLSIGGWFSKVFQKDE